MRKCLVLLLAFIMLYACGGKKGRVDISNIVLEMKIARFDKDLFAIAHDTGAIKAALPQVREKYGSFFELYNNLIIGIGSSYDTSYAVNLELFRSNSTVQVAYKKADSVFVDDSELNRKITDAFKHFKYYFPDKSVPKLYAYISGFAESMALDDSLIGISLDKYLGRNVKEYDMLGIPRYLSRNMYKEKIPADCIRAWAIGDFPMNDESGDNLISKMVYEGKLTYFCMQIMPDEADTVIWGFTAEQLKWCKKNEKSMWAHLMQEKLLYNTDIFTINKLTGDAPYTSIFDAKSPGKACNWIGYKIIEQYMERNPEIDLPQLMANNNHRQIFEEAKYKP